MVKTIKVFDDKYKARSTYDIDDTGFGIYGYEICNENGNFILQYTCEKLSDLIKFLKWKIYKVHANYST